MSVFPQTFPVFLPDFFFWDKFADSFWCFFRVSGCLAAWTEYCSFLPIFRHYCKAHISQLHRTGTVSILKMLKITIILKLCSSEGLKCSANTGAWTSVPQEGYQEGHKAITACAVHPAPHPEGYPTPWGDVSAYSTWGSTILGVALRRGTIPRGKSPFAPRPQGYRGRTAKLNSGWETRGKTLVKMKKLAWKEVLKKHEDLKPIGEILGKWQQPPDDEPFYQWGGVFGLICDSIEKNLNRYGEKYKHDLCSPFDRAQYMQASICVFASINPHKVGEDSLTDVYRAKHDQ